jgi:hypothetical protein
MPFASDNQVVVDPRYIKLTQEDAEIIDVHTVKINTFFFYEGSYPNYTIPNTNEKTYDVSGDTISDIIQEDLTYRNARGINIFINGRLIDNSEIVDYNFGQGLIKIRRVLNVDDDVKITYLEKIDGFLCPYPRLDRQTSIHDSFRLYLRAAYPNYMLDHADDPAAQIKAAYRKIMNGQPQDTMYVCLNNEEVLKKSGYYVPFDGVDHPHAQIADITMIEAITITDERVPGGGIRTDDYFGGIKERLEAFPFSKAYLDIANKNGMEIPQSITFIRIHSDLLTNLEIQYGSKDEALTFLKNHIEKHIGLGIFYVIVDENDELIYDKDKDPFPDTTLGGN